MDDFDFPRGFLPEYAPLERLPRGRAFSHWNTACDALPQSLRAGRVHSELIQLPRVPPEELRYLALEKRTAECAMRKLSFLASALIHPYQEKSQNRIFANLAVPLVYMARRLGREPILSYGSYALENWRRIDKHGPLTLENIQTIDGFLKVPDENWFIIIHVVIEAQAARAVHAVREALDAAQRNDLAYLEQNLFTIVDNLREMHQTLLRMPDGCSPDFYWNNVRPFIFSFKDVVYEGVSEFKDEPRSFNGETGAQSSIVPMLDSALGIRHEASPLIGHISVMREYMPREHRAFIEWIETRQTGGSAIIRDAVIRSRDKKLWLRYNECLAALYTFRAQHLMWAKDYIAKKDKRQPNMGTGGSYLLSFLGQLAQETQGHMLHVETP